MPFFVYNSELVTLAIAAILSVFLVIIWHFKFSENSNILRGLTLPNFPQVTPSGETNNKDAIEPLLHYDLRKVDPIDYRPYRSAGHVTMGITQKSRNEWIRMDRGYISRIQERERLIKHEPQTTICTGPLVNPAIEELYTEVMIDYLPNRYPTIFKTIGKTVHNTITGCTYPLSTAGLTPQQMLWYLGVNVEEDFFFMCPDEGDGEFRLRGFVACFPNGFLAPGRLGQSVREIHQQVPGYEKRLGNGVDRYFQRMKPGQFVGRMSWSLQVDGSDLFRTEGNNYYPDNSQTISEDLLDPSFDKCFLRVEHQTLTCLQQSKAVMFCVRSYITPLEQIKSEGDGPRLAQEIENMPEKLGLYKMRQFWGGKVLPWLKEGRTKAPEPTT